MITLAEILLRLKPSNESIRDDPLVILALVCRCCQHFGPYRLIMKTSRRSCKLCKVCLEPLDLSFNLELSVIDSLGYQDHDLGARMGDMYSPEEFRDTPDIQSRVLQILEHIVAFKTNTTNIDMSKLVQSAIAQL